ncbi:DUF2922 domain-containing protein [Neobacillus sp. OS1-32]|jgi:hypothetical protein|uniref:DUF2922 domain-containing protein n=1 Tax=Neobacillus paridis TaxID=2803862 RepID=A0ABS1TTP3_9BACI|nr:MULTISPECIES: DUF2922 domain-containing protein [Neobacillus]MBL4954647.1 DUF2922 domain-containing protein [Neobacillus paridis]WML29937.1 DUF2922 domain-containing protein [Neobacillus sp. OS1-32]
MAKTLELQFGTDSGKMARISVDNPKEPIDEALVKQAMEQIIAADIFFTSSGKFAVAKGARVIDRNVTEYEII